MNKVLQNTICGLSIAAMPLVPYNAMAISQDETVYAKLQPSGEVSYVSVTNHLINSDQEAKIATRTYLKDIENLNGFENFSLTSENLIWEANGKDIYYSGTTQEDLPVSLEVTYALNGETKPVEEILGKSGEVEIRLKFTNHSKVGDLYTPFVAAVTTTLTESEVRNVNVTNGKVISNGRTVMIAAVAAPGLYDSLKLDELKDLDNITISYETDKFELKDIYSMVTPKILDSSDLEVFSELDGLYADADQLASGSKELVEGTAALQDGVQELYDVLSEAKEQLQGTDKLLDDATLNMIASTAANAAARQVAAQQNAIRAQVHQQITNMPELAELQKSMADMAPLVARQQAQGICLQANAGGAAGTPSTQTAPTVESEDAAADSTEQVAPAESTESTTPTTPAPSTLNCDSITVLDGIVAKYNILPQVQASLSAKLDINKIETALTSSILSSMQQVATTTASTTARQVASQVADSIQEGMSEKLTTLINETLKGVGMLLDGAKELNQGMNKFDEEGIQKITDAVNNKLKPTAEKVRRLTDLADEYNNYSGIGDDVEGETKFILMIEGKKAE